MTRNFKLIFLCLLAIIQLKSTQAQPVVTMQSGEPPETASDADFKDVLGEDDDSFYVIKVKNKGEKSKYYIERYSKNDYTLVSTTDLLPEQITGAFLDPEKIPVRAYLASGKVWIFFYVADPSKSEVVLLVRSADKSGNLSQVMEAGRFPEGNNGHFEISFSPDKSKLSIITILSEPQKPQAVNVSFISLPEFKKVRSVQIPQNYGIESIVSDKFLIDNQLNIYFSFSYVPEKNKFATAIGTIPAGKSEMKVAQLNFPENYHLDGFLFTVNNFIKTLSVTGIYKYRDKTAQGNGLKKMGFFSCRIGLDNFDIISRTEKDLTTGVYDKLDYSGYVSMYGTMEIPQSPGKKFYQVEKYITTEHGEYFIASHSFNIKAIEGKNVHKLGKELIVCLINNKGEIEWMNILPRNTSNNSTGFNTLVYNQKLYCMYLDHPDNSRNFPDPSNYKPEKYLTSSGVEGPDAICISVDLNGKLNKTKFHSNRGFCFVPLAQDLIINNPNGLLVRLVKGAKEKYGVLKVQ